MFYKLDDFYKALGEHTGATKKILEALALVLIGVVFVYVSGENPGPDPASAFRFLISVFPFVCMVLGWVLAWRLELESDE